MSIKKYCMHLVVLSFSAFILGVGCVFYIQAMLGSDAMTTFSQGLSEVLPFSLSICYAGLNFAMFFVALIIDRKQVGLGTLVFPIVSAQSIDISMNYIPVFYGMLSRIVGFVFGMVLIAFAVALASRTECGKNPNDAMNFSLMGVFKRKYNVVRGITDALMLGSGIILGGKWGVGTVVAVLCVGTIAMFFMDCIDQFSFFQKVLMNNDG